MNFNHALGFKCSFGAIFHGVLKFLFCDVEGCKDGTGSCKVAAGSDLALGKAWVVLKVMSSSAGI